MIRKADHTRAQNALQTSFANLQNCKSSIYLQEKYLKALKAIKEREKKALGTQLSFIK